MSLFRQLAAPFPPAAVSWRVGSTTQDKKRGMALAYIDARDVMDRLDAVVGPDCWQCRYPHAAGRTVCELDVWVEGRGWVTKSDGAGDTDVEAEKGALSDAFKRAAVRWGIGRYLYDLDSPWVELKPAGRSYAIADHEMARLQRLLGAAQQPTQRLTALPPDLEPRSRYQELEDALTSALTTAELRSIPADRAKDFEALTDKEREDLKKVYAFKAQALRSFGEAA